MKRLPILASFAVGFLLAGCGEPERPHPAAFRPQPFGGEFNQVGTVSLYPGESCASQIMFVFHGAGSTSTSLAAPWRQSMALKEAAHTHRRVRVVGQWRRAKAPGCTYVEATQVEVQKLSW